MLIEIYGVEVRTSYNVTLHLHGDPGVGEDDGHEEGRDQESGGYMVRHCRCCRSTRGKNREGEVQ
jgi:hypothetical protein